MVVSKWNDADAAKCNGELFALRVYTSRLIGSDEDLVLHGGGNTSVKAPYTNIFGEKIDALYVKGSGWDLATIEKQGFSPVRLDTMIRLPAELNSLSDTELVNIQKQSMLDPNAPGPSIETILHALIPYTFVDHSHSDAVCTVTNTPEAETFIREIYGDGALIVPYCMPGFVLAKEVSKMTQGIDFEKLNVIILLNHGIFTWGNDAKTSYERMIEMVNKAENFLKSKNAYFETLESGHHSREKYDPIGLATLRKAVSSTAGKAMLLKANNSYDAKAFTSLPDLRTISQQGTLTPDHIIHTKRLPAIVDDLAKSGEAISAYKDDYVKYFERNKQPEHKMLDPAPRWILLPGKGWAAAGQGVKQTKIVNDIARHTARGIQWAGKCSCYKCLPEKDLFDVEYWELEQAKLRKGPASKAFDGKVVCVSGAASGIGKAVAKEFLSQGACVLGLDINPETDKAFNSPCYMGVVCDLTNSDAVKAAFDDCAHNFGGVDVLVLNAGILPKSAPIEDIDPVQWDRSMNVNLTASQRLLSAAIPYLKLGVDPSVVIVGTKNAPAPGKGMSCYSVAKAAVVQLGRIATLELAQYGIRVNTVHPDAVFDTGLWTQEILETRSKAYGLTVDQYKRRNLLKAEITSVDVAQTVAALAGPNFSVVTGAQVPVNGGDERTV